jgi:hypothetical protein
VPSAKPSTIEAGIAIAAALMTFALILVLKASKIDTVNPIAKASKNENPRFEKVVEFSDLAANAPNRTNLIIRNAMNPPSKPEKDKKMIAFVPAPLLES